MVPNAELVNKLCPSSDEVLIARLRGLGYTLGLPSIDVDSETVGAASKDDEEAAEAVRFARYRENAPTLLDRLLAAREAEASRDEVVSVDRAELTRAKQARAVETEGDATETAAESSDDGTTAGALQSLLDVVDEHRKSVQAAVAEARKGKGWRDDRSGTSGSRGGSSLTVNRSAPSADPRTDKPTTHALIVSPQHLHCPPPSGCASRPPRRRRARKMTQSQTRLVRLHLVRQQDVVVRGTVISTPALRLPQNDLPAR